MEKFSVKKPFTVLVGLIMVIALGLVSVTRITSDLLPAFTLPYLMVIAPYPGASPERVASTVTQPMENALGTINGVKNVLSNSYENYGLVQLEFESETNMDSAMVKVSSAIDQLSGTLPDAAGTPTIMEISMDMLATMYVAVSHEGYDIYALSDFVKSDIVPNLERQDGVASVTTVGLVEKSVQVELNQKKIDELNTRILEETDSALADARDQLDRAEEAVRRIRKLLDEQEDSFGETLSGAIFGQVDSAAVQGTNALIDQANQVIDRLNALNEAAAALYNEAVNAPAEELPAADGAALEAAAQQLAAQTGTLPDAAALEAAAAQLAAQAGTAPDAAALEDARQQLEQAASSFSAGAQGLNGSPDMAGASAAVGGGIAQIQAALAALSAVDVNGVLAGAISGVNDAISGFSMTLQQISPLVAGLESGYAGLTQAQLEAAVGFSAAQIQLATAEAQLKAAQEQYENGREEALKNANVNGLLSARTLSQLIYAQNFEMPAGYIDDRDNNAWLLRIGETYDSADEIADALLLDQETLGTIRLADVADITVIDNAEESYANLNGSDGVILGLYKSSASSTNHVSRVCNAAFAELEERFPGTTIVPMMDQGIYITYIIKDILSSMLLGSLLAIVVLALFLRTFRPTLVVAISIPLSVLFTLVMMYFSDLTLNMMTLSGLALGIGMLVDNSIVVMENILRLRGRGIDAPRAAVQGARQVRGAITASTLTTICVFLPIVFASGTVRQLLSPLALTIGFCLSASLIVSLTAIPAASSTLLRRIEPKDYRFFAHVKERYGRALSFCLRHRMLTIALAVALLVFSIWQVARMGIVFIPEMTSNVIEVDIRTPEGATREESYAKTDEAIGRILAVEGVQDFGMMDMGSMSGLFSSFSSSDGRYGAYAGYLTVDEKTSPEEIRRICADVEKATEDLDLKVDVIVSGMEDLTGMMSSGGLTLHVFGQDAEKLRETAAQTKALLEEVEGFYDVKDGSEEGDPTLQLHIDRDKAMRYGLTVTGIFQEISSRVETTVNSTAITVDGDELTVTISDPTDPLTKENLMDVTFKTQPMGLMGGGAFPGGASTPGGAYASGNAAAGAAGGMDLESLEDLEDMDDEALLETLMGAGEDEAAEDEAATEKKKKEDAEDKEEDIPEEIRLGDIATVEETTSQPSITRENMTRYLTVTAKVKEGYNITLLSRELQPLIDAFQESLPRGYNIVFAGETSQINDMLGQMMTMMALALLFIYLIMVAQFQSLLSPFIVMFTIPLAFTGGMFGLLLFRQQLTLLSLMGFLVLMGTVVNNGIVFVDYANQLRIQGMERREALIATGKTRMRPILMTALTTILAMGKLIFGSGMGSQLGSGMAVVVAGGLIYATFMTLFIVPVVYDLLFRRPPLSVDTGSDLDETYSEVSEAAGGS